MKQFSKPSVLTSLCAGLGFLCLLVRQWLLSTGIDEKGLLAASHPGRLLSWLLFGAAALAVLLAARHRQVYRFAAAPLSAVSMFFLAAGYFIAAWQLFTGRGQAVTTLSLVAGILGVLSGLCALAQALVLLRGSRPHGLLGCPSIVFFMVFLICRYWAWSNQPELQRYVFQMLAGVTLMLAIYYRTAVPVIKKGARIYLVMSRAALFLCLAAIPGSSYALLCGCSAVSIILDGLTAVDTQGA